MKRIKFITLFASLLSVVFILLCSSQIYTALAEEYVVDKNAEETIESSDPAIEVCGIYTSLSIALNGGDGYVWTTARNDLTIFPSTVYVIVMLFSSDTYCEDYSDMTLEATNSSTDLNMGDSIIAKASTNGEQKYWLGRLRYNVDGSGWKEITVGVGLFNSNGEFVGLI